MEPGFAATLTMTAVTLAGLAAVVWHLGGAILEALF